MDEILDFRPEKPNLSIDTRKTFENNGTSALNIILISKVQQIKCLTF
jgi:hypothetical protein